MHVFVSCSYWFNLLCSFIIALVLVLQYNGRRKKTPYLYNKIQPSPDTKTLCWDCSASFSGRFRTEAQSAEYNRRIVAKLQHNFQESFGARLISWLHCGPQLIKQTKKTKHPWLLDAFGVMAKSAF